MGRYPDVPEGHLFYGDVEALAEAGITRVPPGGLYRPDDPVSRGEMAAFLNRALNLPAPQPVPEPEPEPVPEPDPEPVPEPDPAGTVRFDGSQNYSTWNDDRTLIVEGITLPSLVTLVNARNVTFLRCKGGVIKNAEDGTSDITIQGCTLSAVQAYGNKDASGSRPSRWRIDANDISSGTYCVGMWKRGTGFHDFTISRNRLSRPGRDAIQVNLYDGLTIIGNEFFDIVENGNHNDGIQTVHGGKGIVIRDNWFHDNACQPIFVGKDGLGNEYRDCVIDNNLSDNNHAAGATSSGMHAKIYAISGTVRVTNNTFDKFGFRGAEFGGTVEDYYIADNDFKSPYFDMGLTATDPRISGNLYGAGADPALRTRKYGAAALT